MSNDVFAISLDEVPVPSLLPYTTRDSASVKQDPSIENLAESPFARKADRACDLCRRRKARCDATPTAKCSNCLRNNCPCTFLESSRPRGPSKAYITALEDRVERFERLFKRLRPEADFTDIIGPPVARGSWRSNQRQTTSAAGPSSLKRRHSRHRTPGQPKTFPALNTRRRLETDSEGESDNNAPFTSDDELAPYVPTASSSSILRQPLGDTNNKRFHGKSSLYPLIQAARFFKNDETEPVHTCVYSKECSACKATRRDRGWTLEPWEEAWEHNRNPFYDPLSASVFTQSRRHNPVHDFPPEDLILALFELYFTHINDIYPLLHRPTFISQYNSGLHLTDPNFAGVVWCVMANGARWSWDRRVLWDGWGSDGQGNSSGWDGSAADDPERIKEELEWGSAGWRFFFRSLDGPSFSLSSLHSPCLYDLQFCSLASTFVRGSSVSTVGWVLIGSGLRKAMDVGAHRRKCYGGSGKYKTTVDDELWKRAFWMLVLFDRFSSAQTGRPCLVREEDFDLEMPVEVDDEYWMPSDPTQPPFTQPPGKPSKIALFNQLLKLVQIKAYALRTIYCIDKSKVLLGLINDNWEENIVSRLNAALDAWVDNIPEHLIWKPDIPDDLFSVQSSTLYTSYYSALILIYRPFIKSALNTVTAAADSSPPESGDNESIPSNPESLSESQWKKEFNAVKAMHASKWPKLPGFRFPAQAICASSAHATAHILDAQMRRGVLNLPNAIATAMMVAGVDLTCIWDAKGSSTSEVNKQTDNNRAKSNKEREKTRMIEDIGICMRVLESAESHWTMARKFLHRVRDALPDAKDNFGPPAEKSPAAEARKFFAGRYAEVIAKPTTVQSASSLSSTLAKGNSSDKASNSERRSQSDDLALNSGANWRWFHENPGLLRARVPVRSGVIQTVGLNSEQNQDVYSLAMNFMDEGVNIPSRFAQSQDTYAPEMQDTFKTASDNYAMTSSAIEKGHLRYHTLAHMRSPKARGGIIVDTTASTSSQFQEDLRSVPDGLHRQTTLFTSNAGRDASNVANVDSLISTPSRSGFVSPNDFMDSSRLNQSLSTSVNYNSPQSFFNQLHHISSYNSRPRPYPQPTSYTHAISHQYNPQIHENYPFEQPQHQSRPRSQTHSFVPQITTARAPSQHQHRLRHHPSLPSLPRPDIYNAQWQSQFLTPSTSLSSSLSRSTDGPYHDSPISAGSNPNFAFAIPSSCSNSDPPTFHGESLTCNNTSVQEYQDDNF